MERGRVAERVAAEIRQYIEANGLEPGYKLPPERIFIERMGVSRSSLREALRVLSTVGLIEVRHGDGMYVAAATDTWDPSPKAIFDATEEHALRNLVETRLGIEMAAATAATLRASDDDLAALQRLVDAQAEALENDADYEWQPLEFELAMVEITGNTWLYEVEVMLRDAWLSLSGGLLSDVGRHWEWLNEHRAMLSSMRSRNLAQVQRLVMAHLSLERFEEDLKSRGSRAKSGKRARATKGRTAT
jgi:GntR family transcriptional repressor for pyruvate dehydrogenase complex